MIKKITLFVVGLLIFPTSFINAQCELNDNNLFTGDYYATQVTPGIFGYDTFSPDGNSVLIRLYSGMTNFDQDVANVPLPNDIRSFDAEYLSALNGGVMTTFAMKFNEGCEASLSANAVPEISNTGIWSCQGSPLIYLDYASGGSYNDNNDDAFTLVFQDDAGNFCGLEDTFVTIQFSRESLNISDNRTSNFKHWVQNKTLNFSNNKLLFKNLEIYDLSGKLVLTEFINSNDGAIDLSVLKSGLYIVKFHSDFSEKTTKIIVE